MAKLFLGNVPWSVSNMDLEQLLTSLELAFEKVEVVYDKETDRSRGFAFLHFETDEDAAAAKVALTDYELKGRQLFVDVANARQENRGGQRRRGGGGGFDRGGGGRGRGPRGYRDEDNF